MSHDSNKMGGANEVLKEALSDVDRLLAEAMEEAEAEARKNAEGEIQTVQLSKRKKSEMAERAEELQQTIAGYAASDAGVEDFYYEDIFTYAEAVTGVAMPKKAGPLLEKLRKAGEGLRKLAGIESRSPVFLTKVEELRDLHDRLFAEVQELVVDTLERLKKKFKGEASAFEARFKLLTESPLVRGVEHHEDTAEARMEGMKQEIVELLLRPFVDNRLGMLEKRLKNLPEELEKLRKDYENRFERRTNSLTDTSNIGQWEIDAFARSHASLASTRMAPNNLVWNVRQAMTNLESKIGEYARRLPQEKLVFEVNRSIIQSASEGAKDEAELLQAVQELSQYLEKIRGHVDREGSYASFGWSQKSSELPVPLPGSVLAKKILGYYGRFAVSLPGSYSDDPLMVWLSPEEQLLGKRVEERDLRGMGVSAKEYLDRECERAFLEASGFKGSDMEIGQQARMDPRNRRLSVEPETEKLWNLKQAHKRVDAGYEGKKEGLEPLPEQLAKAGWTLSKLGAFVAPGHDSRIVDREHSRILDKLSEPQIETERAFDVRSPEGDFHVYTTKQAMDLLRRARRDARDILETTERAIMEAQGEVETQKRDTEEAKGALSNKGYEMEGLVEKVRQREEELKAAHAKALEEAKKKLIAAEKTSEEKLSKLGSELQEMRLLDESHVQSAEEANDTLKAVKKKLHAALKTEPGIFGGEKALRKAIEDLVRALEQK